MMTDTELYFRSIEPYCLDIHDGDSEAPTGWFALTDVDADGEYEITLASELDVAVPASGTYVIVIDGQGFVYVQAMATREDGERAYAELSDAYSAWLDSEDSENG